jgi:hypothetical protein
MDFLRGDVIHLAAAYAVKGAPVTVVATKANQEPLRYLVAIDSSDKDLASKILTDAGFDLRMFEVVNKDFDVRLS